MAGQQNKPLPQDQYNEAIEKAARGVRYGVKGDKGAIVLQPDPVRARQILQNNLVGQRSATINKFAQVQDVKKYLQQKKPQAKTEIQKFFSTYVPAETNSFSDVISIEESPSWFSYFKKTNKKPPATPEPPTSSTSAPPTSSTPVEIHASPESSIPAKKSLWKTLANAAVAITNTKKSSPQQIKPSLQQIRKHNLQILLRKIKSDITDPQLNTILQSKQPLSSHAQLKSYDQQKLKQGIQKKKLSEQQIQTLLPTLLKPAPQQVSQAPPSTPKQQAPKIQQQPPKQQAPPIKQTKASQQQIRKTNLKKLLRKIRSDIDQTQLEDIIKDNPPLDSLIQTFEKLKEHDRQKLQQGIKQRELNQDQIKTLLATSPKPPKPPKPAKPAAQQGQVKPAKPIPAKPLTLFDELRAKANSRSSSTGKTQQTQKKNP